MPYQTLSPGTTANDATNGNVEWSNSNNAKVSDGVYATSVLPNAYSSYYLKATNFGFSIPTGATINGIVVELQVKSSVLNTIYTDVVKLVKNGTIGGLNVDNTTRWSTSEAYLTHGNSSNLWGNTFTPSDINDSTFGVAIYAHNASVTTGTAYIDHIRITVYYDYSTIVTDKRFSAKVYSNTNTYITTWDKDVVDGISFNNEINSAGGQMVITLARNAGDYGEGSDVDFGHRVKVYCFDKESPDGLVIFQGYISAYTPIYSDNKVDVTVMGYGAELNDYILEAGESSAIVQADSDGYYAFGNYASMSNTQAIAQTVTTVGASSIRRIEFTLKTILAYRNVAVIAGCYLGNPDTGTWISSSNSVTVVNNTAQLCSFVFSDAIPYTDGQVYSFSLSTVNQYYPGSDKYPVCVADDNTAGYAGGSVWVYYNG